MRVVVVLIAALVLAGTAQAHHVNRLSNAVLAKEARKVATHGGVTGTCWGCATPYMKRLSYELVERAFRPSYRSWALCVVQRESGFNPGAVSRTDDHGLPQFNRPSHPWVNYVRLKIDPAYAVRAMVRLSKGGTYTQPWGGACG